MIEELRIRGLGVIDESVLHRPIGGRQVLHAQLEHLLDITALPTVTLQVLPFELGRSAAEGAFTILRFAAPEIPDIVYLEQLTSAVYLDKRADVEEYQLIMERVTVQAETPAQSRETLRRLLAEL